MKDFDELNIPEKIKRLDGLDTIGDEDSEFIFSVAQSASNENLRAAAIKLVGRAGRSDSLTVLDDILNSEGATDFINRTALYAVAETGHSHSVRLIVGFLRSSPNYQTKRHALTALSQIKSIEAINALVEYLDDSNRAIRSWIAVEVLNSADVIHKTEKEKISRKLKEMALSDGEASVRRATLRTISAFTEDESEFFKSFIARETDQKNVLRAIEALASQETQSGVAILISIVVQERRPEVAKLAANCCAGLADLTQKWTAFENFLRNHAVAASYVNYDLVVQAIGGDLSRNATKLSGKRLSPRARRDT